MHVCVMRWDWMLGDRALAQALLRGCSNPIPSVESMHQGLDVAVHGAIIRLLFPESTLPEHSAHPGALGRGKGGWGIGRKSRQGRTGLAPGRARGNLLPTVNGLSQPHSSSKRANRHLRYGWRAIASPHWTREPAFSGCPVGYGTESMVHTMRSGCVAGKH